MFTRSPAHRLAKQVLQTHVLWYHVCVQAHCGARLDEEQMYITKEALSMAAMGTIDQTDTSDIKDTIIEAIGNTPLVRLHKTARGMRPELLAKVEFLNPGGSVKDRIGLGMIEAAEREGRLRPGGTIVEGTSGNTGVGLAIAAALKGYKTIFVMPDKMSDEKIRQLRAFGARVVITPTAVEPDDPRSYYSVSRRLSEETPNAILAGQYWNPANPAAHYQTTGPELWRQTGGRISVFVAGMGTGGTISGVGRYLKEQNPGVKIIGVDPIGSLLHHYFHTRELGPAHSYKVEGVGEDFLPSTLDFDVIDDTIQVTDREAFTMTRRLVREEGLFCGGSSGMAMAGALKWLRTAGTDLAEDDVVVVLLPDSGSRYLSKVFDDNWLRENGFLEQASVGDLLLGRPREVITATEDTSVEAAIRQMKTHGISQLPVLDGAGRLHGIIGEGDLLDYLISGGAMDHTIADLHAHEVSTVDPDMPLDELTAVFGRSQAAVVVRDGAVEGIVTKIDVIDFLANRR
jgi:cystathionine beta-synthase